MDIGCRDGAFRGSDNELIEPANHVAGRIKPAYRSFNMRIDRRGTVAHRTSARLECPA
jgi:hypothetical protein